MNLDNLFISPIFFDEIAQPIFLKNRHGIYVYCNKAFSDFLGKPIDYIVGFTPHHFSPHHVAELCSASDQTLLDSHHQQQYQYYFSTIKTTAHEHEYEIAFKKAVLYNTQKQVVGFIGTVEMVANPEKKKSDLLKRLSEREVEIVNLLATGCSVKTIAKLLQISPFTVADHLKSIYRKLDVHSKNEAIYKAISLFPNARP
jgi:DNA-binding CsgD family transcriptional regulator